eukprot:scaffold22568_cov125-Cylindrotheca_fusiformis.AAC.4
MKMMRHERLLDLGRYRKYREKGRISPRATGSISTSSLSTSPTSTATSSFSNSQQKPLRGIDITEEDMKYKSGPTDQAAPDVEKTPLGETPLSKYVNTAQNQIRTRNHPQTKEERERKLKKWERFRSAQKASEADANKMLATSTTQRPPRPAAATLFPSSSFASSTYSFGSVPRRIGVVNSTTEIKENLPTEKATRRQPMDSPKVRPITSKHSRRTLDPPTRRAPSPMSSQYPRDRSPVSTTKMQQLPTPVEVNCYGRAKTVSRQDTSTAFRSRNMNTLPVAPAVSQEGRSAENPIRLEDLDISHMDVSAPVIRNTPELIDLCDSNLATPSESVDRSEFDFSFSPKFQPERSLRIPSPTIKFDFSPSNHSTATMTRSPRSNSPSADFTAPATSFDFSSLAVRSKQEAQTTAKKFQTTTPPLSAQKQHAVFKPPAIAYASIFHNITANQSISRPPPPRSGGSTGSASSRVSGVDRGTTLKSEPRRQNLFTLRQQRQPSDSTRTASREYRDRLLESREGPERKQTTRGSENTTNHPAGPNAYRQTPSRDNIKQPSVGSGSQSSDDDIGPLVPNNESEAFTSKRLDQKDVRMMFSRDFSHMIQKQKMRDKLLGPKSGKSHKRFGGNGVTFVARKRPITEKERKVGEYDVVNTDTSNPGRILVYKTQVLPDSKTKDLTSHTFRCNEAVSEHLPTGEFYVRVVEPLVDVAKKGGFATIVVCGSPGSGKTQTMADISEWASNDIFRSGSSRLVSLQYVEVTDKNCYDLLSPGSFVNVVNKEAGYFQLEGAKTATASNTSALIRLISNARRRLAMRTSIRKKSDGSSFVLCQIKIKEEERRKSGCLTVLECPATEPGQIWSPSVDPKKPVSPYDALLECISAKISQRTITNPFRNFNNLTKLMKEVLETRGSHVCVCVTMSPLASETELTLSTLSSIGNVMRGYKPKPRSLQTSTSRDSKFSLGVEDLALPRQWTNEELYSWMKRKNLNGISTPANINGRLAMRLSKKQLREAFYGPLDCDMATKLYVALRTENDRVARLRVKRRMSASQK